MPIEVLTMAMAGGSAPVTLAGTLVTHNAEVLAGITLAQLTEPRHAASCTARRRRPWTCASPPPSVGSPELALIGAGVAQLARQYRLPSYVSGA